MANFVTPVAKKGKIQDQNATREALKVIRIFLLK
jgi:hypothetical protein